MANMMMAGAGLAAAWSLLGAATPAAAQTHAPEATLRQVTADAVARGGEALVSASVRDGSYFCPQYATLDTEGRSRFWAAFLAAVATAESGGDARKTHWRAYSGDARRPVIDRALFQIAIESATRDSYRCEVTKPEDLASPDRNAACAVRIAAHWTLKDHAIYDQDHGRWRGAARFWPRLRHADVRAAIAAETSIVPDCAPR